MSMSTKRLEEAEKRRLEWLQKKTESLKRKNDEWKLKIETNKLAEEKKLKAKQEGLQHAAPSSNIFRKLAQRLFGKPVAVAAGGSCSSKIDIESSTKMPGVSSKLPAPLSKNPFHKAKPSSPVTSEMANSLKIAKAANDSFLDETVDQGHLDLDNFDITAYEEYDEELKHRSSKTLPSWASDRESLRTALFSVILMPDYEKKLPGGFPKPDKTYKLFPNAK